MTPIKDGVGVVRAKCNKSWQLTELDSYLLRYLRSPPLSV